MPAAHQSPTYTEHDDLTRRRALHIRAKLGMTVKEFAANMGANPSSVLQYERGMTRWPARFHALIERDFRKLTQRP